MACCSGAPNGPGHEHQDDRANKGHDDIRYDPTRPACAPHQPSTDGAADNLLEIIARDRAWNEGAARARLLKLLEVVGLEDSWVRDQRRRLSAILFT